MTLEEAGYRELQQQLRTRVAPPRTTEATLPARGQQVGGDALPGPQPGMAAQALEPAELEAREAEDAAMDDADAAMDDADDAPARSRQRAAEVLVRQSPAVVYRLLQEDVADALANRRDKAFHGNSKARLQAGVPSQEWNIMRTAEVARQKRALARAARQGS